MEKSASQARIFDSNEQLVLAKATLKQGSNAWNGVAPHSTLIRTCDLELPRGHATVRCGALSLPASEDQDVHILTHLARQVLRGALFPERSCELFAQVSLGIIYR